jgi:hypothetical protein
MPAPIMSTRSKLKTKIIQRASFGGLRLRSGDRTGKDGISLVGWKLEDDKGRGLMGKDVTRGFVRSGPSSNPVFFVIPEVLWLPLT